MTLAALKALAGTREWQDWRWQLAHSISEPRSLAEALQLDVRVAADVRRVHCRYPVLATPYYLALARTTSLSDPILRQCVPLLEELRDAPAAGEDPLGEEQDAPVPNLVHRYADRALLLLTARCALHCRHCMRKRRWRDAREAMNGSALEPALEYVRAHPEIREVLLSGGDPLLLDPEFLARVLRQLHALPHVEVIRIGSRLPVVLPQRLTREYCDRLGRYGPVWVATHFNHPLELTAAAGAACENLLRSGIPVINQTVLLRGVNDDVEVMRALCTGLMRLRVVPYALYHGDPAAGTLHFRTGLAKGVELMGALDGRISGPALPVFAFDLPGGGGKIRLGVPRRQGRDRSGNPVFEDRCGNLVSYPDPVEAASEKRG